MNFTSALNVILGSAVLIVLMFIDYVRKYNTDGYQRGLFLNVLIFAFISMAADFIYFLAGGRPGMAVHVILNVSIFAYYFFQVLSYFYVALFADYITFKSRERTGLIKAVVWIFAAFHGLLLILNFRGNFYFYVSDANVFYRGSIYVIRLAVCFLPVIFAFLDVFSMFKNFRTHAVLLMLIFVVLTGAGSALDILLKTTSLVWPCFVTALLYAYFFIVQSDTKIDSLTGLGNRYSFNEFIDKLSSSKGGEFSPLFRPRRRSTELNPYKKRRSETYSIVMIDMDHFKEINDTLGHLEGDNALRDMAAIIKSCIRQSDFAARYGGDEFVLATRAENGVTALLGRIQAAVDTLNAKKERPYMLEISYGYDIYTAGSGMPINDFLHHIDSLMYKHKNERRRKTDKNPGKENDAAFLS